MQFHHHGYVSEAPLRQPAAGVGIDRPQDLPDQVDVLIVGTGPAGLITAAQLAAFASVSTRIIERRPGRLEVGQADGIQARSVETFQAFGFANRIIDEAYQITTMSFWKPDPAEPSRIIRTARTPDDPAQVSEFPHLIVNQARVQDYFLEAMANGPARLAPDYGVEFRGLAVAAGGEYPVTVAVHHLTGPRAGEDRSISARYVVGADGARSGVRTAIGRTLEGSQALHAWGVMDVLAVTDFPDIRIKCAIQSQHGGSILLIPREGGQLFRMYVDLGEVDAADNGRVRATTIEEIIAQANRILSPYRLDVRHVAWHSVYEVGHRLTDRFDDSEDGQVGVRTPRVFIAGDACHTHSAKAGQGMNVSMQDGFNLGWKLGHVIDRRAPESLLDTYSAERQVVAQNLIDFDRRWSTMMAADPSALGDPSALEDFYLETFEFPAGFMTQYAPSLLVGDADDAASARAAGFPLGKRFRSAWAVRAADAKPIHLGHHARADGRWRIYVFADPTAAGEPSPLTDLADWLATDPDSPLAATPSGLDLDAHFDVKVIYQQDFTAVDVTRVPAVFRPLSGPFGLIDHEKVYAVDPSRDIFDERGVDRAGAIVVVRPDQYVAQVLALTATSELAAFFSPLLRPRRSTDSSPPSLGASPGPR